MAEFRMPSLGSEMEEGILSEWRVKVGDRVERGDIVAVVQTQKAAIEVEIFSSGVIESLLVQEGAKVPVGTVLAILQPTQEPARLNTASPPAAAPPAPAPPAPAPPTVGTDARQPPALAKAPLASAAPASAFGEHPRHRASPAARRRARELGLDPLALEVDDGIIRLADVERIAARAPSPTKIDRQARVAAARAATAAAMSRAKREIPHYYLAHTFELEPALRWLERYNEERRPDQRILPAVQLLKATALALREIPELNGRYTNGNFEAMPEVDLNIAIALRGGGVVAPVLRGVDRLALDELMAGLRDLVTHTREARLRSSEIAVGTATVSNLGETGVDAVFGIIYPPQVALVGFGGIAPRPWTIDGLLGIRRVIQVTLSADHRSSEGHRGSSFLRSIEARLQAPETL